MGRRLANVSLLCLSLQVGVYGLSVRCLVASLDESPLTWTTLAAHSPQGPSPTITVRFLTRALARLLCVSNACLMHGDANLLFEYFQVLHGLSMIVTYLAQGGVFEVWAQNSMLIWNCTSVIFEEAYMSILLQNPPLSKTSLSGTREDYLVSLHHSLFLSHSTNTVSLASFVSIFRCEFCC